MLVVALALGEIVYFLWFYKSFEPQFPNSVDFGMLGYLRASTSGRGSSLSWFGVVVLGHASSYRINVLALLANVVFTWPRLASGAWRSSGSGATLARPAAASTAAIGTSSGIA